MWPCPPLPNRALKLTSDFNVRFLRARFDLLAVEPWAFGGDGATPRIAAYFADGGRILVIPENSGAIKTLRPLVETGRLAHFPRLLDDGETLLFTEWYGSAAQSRLMAYSLASDSVSAPASVARSHSVFVTIC